MAVFYRIEQSREPIKEVSKTVIVGIKRMWSYYERAPGFQVFQIKEDTFSPGEHDISRKISFVDRSTRKHYPGEHRISIVVNGVAKAETEVMLQ